MVAIVQLHKNQQFQNYFLQIIISFTISNSIF